MLSWCTSSKLFSLYHFTCLALFNIRAAEKYCTLAGFLIEPLLDMCGLQVLHFKQPDIHFSTFSLSLYECSKNEISCLLRVAKLQTKHTNFNQ
jgi:hypothetical protein